jgi:hypothetical protein
MIQICEKRNGLHGLWPFAPMLVEGSASAAGCSVTVCMPGHAEVVKAPLQPLHSGRPLQVALPKAGCSCQGITHSKIGRRAAGCECRDAPRSTGWVLLPDRNCPALPLILLFLFSSEREASAEVPEDPITWWVNKGVHVCLLVAAKFSAGCGHADRAGGAVRHCISC